VGSLKITLIVPLKGVNEKKWETKWMISQGVSCFVRMFLVFKLLCSDLRLFCSQPSPFSFFFFLCFFQSLDFLLSLFNSQDEKFWMKKMKNVNCELLIFFLILFWKYVASFLILENFYHLNSVLGIHFIHFMRIWEPPCKKWIQIMIFP